VPNWIIALSFYSLPLIELSSKKLNEKEKKRMLSTEVKENVKFWKRARGIEEADELEYKYFLEGIDAIKVRAINPEDMNVPLSDNLLISDILGSEQLKAKMYYLSKFGSWLATYWTNERYTLYEMTLFWLLIRSKNFTPLIQKMLSDPRIYHIGFQDMLIPSQDGVSRTLVKKWLKYFGLIERDHINRSRLAALLLCSSVMEINEKIAQVGNWKEYVSKLCQHLSSTFSISEVAVDFSILLDYIYSQLERSTIEGFPSGRGHRGLPSRPSVQILEIKSPIPLSLLESIQVSEIRKAILFEG
jgi:hypothetical protein